MSKIKELTLEAAAELRQSVQRRFLSVPDKRVVWKVNSYKESYQDLKNDIIRMVPEAVPAISLTRLRKLFYYTDPAICPSGQVEKPSFGSDFIEALLQYIAEDKPSAAKTPADIRPYPQKKWWKTIALLLLLMTTIVVWQWADQPENWEEPFDEVSLEGLKSRGWQILDYDSTYFGRQTKKGCFTAYTLRGDYWWTLPDTPVIKNFLYKKLDKNPVYVTLKIDEFNPSQGFQQAGIILLDKNQDPDHNIRITFSGGITSPTSLLQSLQIVKREHGVTYEQKYPLRQSPASDPYPVITPIWLQICIEGNKFKFYYHQQEEFDSFSEIGAMEFDFEPEYVGVAAFRGLRNTRREINNSEAIPALFDYVKVVYPKK